MQDFQKDEATGTVTFRTSVSGTSHEHRQALLNYLALNPDLIKKVGFVQHTKDQKAYAVYIRYTERDGMDSSMCLGKVSDCEPRDEFTYRIAGGYSFLIAADTLCIDADGNQLKPETDGVPAGFKVYAANQKVFQYYAKKDIPLPMRFLMEQGKLLNKPCSFGLELEITRRPKEHQIQPGEVFTGKAETSKRHTKDRKPVNKAA
jgi:hypothetical protein